MNKTTTWKTIKTKKVTAKGLEKAGINVSDYAKDMMEKIPGYKPQEINLVRVTPKEMGLIGYPTTTQIYAKAKELGLELCPAEVGPLLRVEYTDQPLSEWLIVAMEPIAGRVGDPNVFSLARDADGLWLHSLWAGPDATCGIRTTSSCSV